MFYVIAGGTIIKEVLQTKPTYFKRQDNGTNILSNIPDYDYIYSNATDVSYDRVTHSVHEFTSIPQSDNVARDYILVNDEFVESDYLILSKKMDEIEQSGAVYDDIINAIKDGVNSI